MVDTWLLRHRAEAPDDHEILMVGAVFAHALVSLANWKWVDASLIDSEVRGSQPAVADPRRRFLFLPEISVKFALDTDGVDVEPGWCGWLVAATDDELPKQANGALELIG